MESNILNAISEESFRLKAFSDYCDKVQSRYQTLLVAENSLLEVVPDDPDNEPEYTDEYISDFVDGVLETNNLDQNNQLLFNDGYCNIKYALSQAAKRLVNDLTGVDHYETTDIDLTLADGTSSTSIDIDVMTNEIKNNLLSVTGLCAANRAMVAENVADRIAIFNDKLSSVYSDAYSGALATAGYLRNVISDSSVNIKQYFANLDNALNLSALAADDSIELPSGSDISAYTGSSPACALNFGGVFSAVGTVLNAGLKVVAGIVVGAYNLVKGLFKKAFSWIHSIVVDPYDIEEINQNQDDVSETVDGWCFNSDSMADNSEMYANAQSFINQYVQPEDFEKYLGKWIKFETIFGETLISLNNISKNQLGNWIRGWKVRFKPKSINPDVVYQTFKDTFSLSESQDTYGVKGCSIQTRNTTSAQWVDFINNLTNSPSLYISTDAPEKKLILSFKYACALELFLSDLGFKEMNGSLSETGDWYTSNSSLRLNEPDDYISKTLTGQVSNIAFLRAVSGWNEAYESFQDSYDITMGYATSNLDEPTLVSGLMNSSSMLGRYHLLSWILNKADEQRDPIGYTFIPYRDNVDSFRVSKFRIRTDAENQKAFNTFMTIAVVLVVVAVVSITAIVLIKKMSRSIFMKRTAEVGRMDNAMWNSQPLTAKEKRRYIRLQRKLNGSKALTSGLQDFKDTFTSISDSVSTVSEDISGTAQILQLIRN